MMIKISIVCIAILALGLIFSYSNCAKETEPLPQSIYSISVKTIDGKTMDLSAYKGKVVFIVNVASKCGFTHQYKGLETLYETYKDKGLIILGFPSNDFAWQEPGSDSEIATFCKSTYNVSFPMFSKVKTNGGNAHPLYKYLCGKSSNPDFSGRITWNFNKFLIDRNGKVIARFGSKDEPLDRDVIDAIEKALK
jgi:glutathione peroxidase